MNLTMRQRLLASTLMIGATGLIATPAVAQSQDQQPENAVQAEPSTTPNAQEPLTQDVQDAQEVVITGSRIARRDLTSTSPIAVVQDEEFALSGAVNVEQVINTLPQVIPGATAFSNNPGGGVATLNLRGLGSNRNLVLVNGRRYIFFDTNQVTDLNSIPSFLVESVDVVTGGASAVYGSDALAGVTNFRLRRDVAGLIAGGQYSITQRGDGARYNVYGALGTQFADGRGHLAVYGEYYNRGDIFQGARDFSRYALIDGATDLVRGGSANVPQGRFTVPGTLAIGAGASCGGAGQPPRNAGCYVVAENTVFNADNAGGIFLTPGTATGYTGADAYNYAPANYLMVPQKRWSLGGYGEYEVADRVNAYAEVAFVNNQVVNQLAATPITQPVVIDLNNTAFCGAATSYISAATCTTLGTISGNQLAANAAAAAAGSATPFAGVTRAGQVRLTSNYRVTQISNRINTDDRNAFRVLGGLRGEIVDGLNYDLYYSYARTKNSQTQIGNVSRSGYTANVQNGTCNVFGPDQLSQECIDAIAINSQNQDTSVLQVASGSISGNAWTSPWATDAVGFAAGVEWRKVAAEFVPDTALSSGDVVGFNAGDPTKGNYDVKEVFGELRVPLIQDNFISRLELSGAARYSDYSLEAVGGVWTYAVGAELAPVRDITFRGQYQRAVRAPNVQELFGGQSVGFPAATDPCATAAAITDAAIRQVCIDTGVPAGSVGLRSLQPNSQIEGLFGGNALLEEEVGDTYTVGAVIRPSFIPRLNLTVDYYNIEVKNVISPAGGGVGGVLDLCYNTIQDANSPICQLINRDPSGSLSGAGVYVVTALNQNLGRLISKGIDWSVDYSYPVNYGFFGPSSKLNFFFLGSYTKESTTEVIQGAPETQTKCAGKFGNLCGNPTPKWKWSSRLSWMDGPLTSTIRWRHVNSVRDDDDSTDYIIERLPKYNLFDLAFSANVTDNLTMNFGINNLFDKKPPIAGDNQEQSNTFPGTYDVLGRDFFVSASVKF